MKMKHYLSVLYSLVVIIVLSCSGWCDVSEIKASRGTVEDTVELEWSDVRFASRYQIFRSINYNGPYIPIKTTENTYWSDTCAENGVYYWYRVIPWYWIFPAESGKRVQGWVKPSIAGEMMGTFERLLKIVKQVPHFLNVRSMVDAFLNELPDPVTIDPLVPSDDEMYSWVEQLCKGDHRRTGTVESKAAVDYIEQELASILGAENVSVDEIPLDFVYRADSWGLEIETGETIDSYFAFNTGISNRYPNGLSVEGEMVWAGTGTPEEYDSLGDIDGKVVIVECDFYTMPVGLLSLVFNRFYSTSDHSGFIQPDTSYPLSAMRSNFPNEYDGNDVETSIYWLAERRGAAALVMIMKNFPGNTNRYGGPYDAKLREMPCLWVNADEGEELKLHAEKGDSVRVTIRGDISPGVGYNVYGVLPGRTDEVILVTSHHDSLFKGATEDGTGVAMVLAQAKAWSKVPESQREKTIVFVLADGHFYKCIGVDDFRQRHFDDIMKHVIVNINLEHLASRGMNIDANGELVDAGRPSLKWMFATDNPVPIATAVRMVENRKPDLSIVAQSTLVGDVPPGEAGHYHLAGGVDFIHWIGMPVYLLDDRDTLDKVDINRLNFEATCVSELIGTYMAMPPGYSYYE